MSNETSPILIIVILVLAAAIAYAGYNYGHVNATTPTVIAVTPVPTPTPIPDTSYLTNVVTVSGMTCAAGFAQVNILQDNRIFDVPYSYYDELSPEDRVQFHVVSTYNPYGTVVYKVDYVNIISHHRSNTRYYYWNDRYYRNDDRVTIEVTRDEANRHGYTRDRPNWWLDDE